MQSFWKRFSKDRVAVFGVLVIIIAVLAAVSAPVIAPYNPTEQFFDGLTLEGAPLPPSERFWFGTDTNGRDQFSRLLYGARTSLIIGLVANGIAVAIGTIPVITATIWVANRIEPVATGTVRVRFESFA